MHATLRLLRHQVLRLTLFRSVVCGASCGVLILLVSCGHPGRPLNAFDSRQKEKIPTKSVYLDAELDFWVATYKPSMSDVQALRESWHDHGKAFPESRGIDKLVQELHDPSHRIYMIGLFMTQYENADLRSKALGWAVYPVPSSIEEYPGDDVPLQTLMPLKNAWARYFIVRYPAGSGEDFSHVIVSNRTSRAELPLDGAE